MAYDLTSASPTTASPTTASPASGTSTQAEAAPAVSAAKGVGSLIGGGAGASGAASPPAGGAPSASATASSTRPPPLPIEDRKSGFISQFERLFASSPELAKFAGYADLKGVAEGVWDKLNSTVAATGAPMAAVGKDDSDRVKITARDASGAATGTDPQFAAAMALAKPFADMMKSYVKENQEAMALAKKGFAFWSGKPAKAAAKESGLQSLEGSQLGGVFDTAKLLPDNVNMAIWGALSKAYAEWATEDMSGKEYRGYVGVGGDEQESIYNAVERWVVDGAGEAAKKAGVTVPQVQWFAVVPATEAYAAAPAADKVDKLVYKKGDSDVAKELSTREAAVAAMQQANKDRLKLVAPAPAAAPAAAASAGTSAVAS